MYDCPENCVSCNAHRKCLSCSEGFHLEKGLCRAFDDCLIYADANFEVCEQYCSQKCSVCAEEMDNCLACNEKLFEGEDSGCQVQKRVLWIGILLLAFTTFKTTRFRSLYLMLANFELYQYHLVSYDGAFAQVLETLNSINGAVEKMLLSDFLRGFLQQQNELTDFNAFSNEKYLEVERVNTLFSSNVLVISSTKLLLRVLAFLLFNWLFYRTFNHRISKLFRPYSFKLFFIEALLLGEIPFLVFIAFNHSKTLFRIGEGSIVEFVVHIVMITGFGIAFILLVCLPFFYLEYYKKLSKYFFNNMEVGKESLGYMFGYYVLKPVILGAIHASLF